MRRVALATAMATLLALACAGEAAAGPRRKAVEEGPALSPHPKAHYYRHRKHYGPQVRGYVARRGGYSYSIADMISTYGSSRTLYGGSRFYRDAQLDRQTTSGPFDHGYFFDSGIGPRGGDSPYMH